MNIVGILYSFLVISLQVSRAFHGLKRSSSFIGTHYSSFTNQVVDDNATDDDYSIVDEKTVEKKVDSNGLSLLAKKWDWRNGFGTNLVSPVKDQHNPYNCGSCWAHASAAVIADRTNVRDWVFRRQNWTMSVGSIQYMISCSGVGTCVDGGDERDVYAWVKKNGGFPHESCLNYVALDVQCKQCLHCNETSCEQYKPTQVMTVLDYKTVKGEKHMKLGMIRDGGGPISCAIYATNGMLNYTGGIYKEVIEDVRKIDFNHVVEVVGWGDNYWIIKNSWGMRWGEGGFMRLSMDGKFNLGIDRECSYPIVGGWKQ